MPINPAVVPRDLTSIRAEGARPPALAPDSGRDDPVPVSLTQITPEDLDPDLGGPAAVVRALTLIGLRPSGPLPAAWLAVVGGGLAASSLGRGVGLPSGDLLIPSAATAGADAASGSTATAPTRATDSGASPAAPTLLPGERLAVAGLHPATVSSGPDALPPDPRFAPAPDPLAAGGDSWRRAAADLVLPPAHLADYDRVLPLPLIHQGLPQPARLAVATRRTADGRQAAFLRVDGELSRLGPVSARLSGVEGGPIAVTLLATKRGTPALLALAPVLTQALADLGLTAGIRVVESDEVHG